MNKQKPFYKSVKKMLGIFSTLCYWGIQFYVVKEETSLVTSFIIPDVSLIVTLLALKKLNLDRKDKGDE